MHGSQKDVPFNGAHAQNLSVVAIMNLELLSCQCHNFMGYYLKNLQPSPCPVSILSLCALHVFFPSAFYEHLQIHRKIGRSIQ